MNSSSFPHFFFNFQFDYNTFLWTSPNSLSIRQVFHYTQIFQSKYKQKNIITLFSTLVIYADCVGSRYVRNVSNIQNGPDIRVYAYFSQHFQ